MKNFEFFYLLKGGLFGVRIIVKEYELSGPPQLRSMPLAKEVKA
jgi:hypothetical protein